MLITLSVCLVAMILVFGKDIFSVKPKMQPIKIESTPPSRKVRQRH